MDINRARYIVRGEVEKHKKIAKAAKELNLPTFEREHMEIAAALELLLEEAGAK